MHMQSSENYIHFLPQCVLLSEVYPLPVMWDLSQPLFSRSNTLRFPLVMFFFLLKFWFGFYVIKLVRLLKKHLCLKVESKKAQSHGFFVRKMHYKILNNCPCLGVGWKHHVRALKLNQLALSDDDNLTCILTKQNSLNQSLAGTLRSDSPLLWEPLFLMSLFFH